MDLFVALCVSIPLVSFGTTIIRDATTIRSEIMASKKKIEPVWKCRDGKEILISKMEDLHLSNSIKMVVRNIYNSYEPPLSPTLDGTKNKTLQKLLNEAKKRKFQIHLRSDCPYNKDGRLEYVDVILPNPRSRLDVGYFPTDWDSRFE